MTKMVRLLGVLLLLALNDNAWAQERFGGFIEENQVLIYRGSSEKVLINCVTGKESRLRNDAGSSRQHSAMSLQSVLDDGSLISLMKGDLYRLYPDGTEKRLTQDAEISEENPTLSADQSKIAYTKRGNLYFWDFKNEEEIQLTEDGGSTVYNGWASWIYYEEILGRSSYYKAFWWSPDSKHIAYLRFDDNPVPIFPIYRLGNDNRGYLELMRYPKAGDENPKVKLGIVDTEDKMTEWITGEEDTDQYTAWPFWSPDGVHLIYQQLNRGQDTLSTKAVRVSEVNKPSTILVETSKTWIEFHEEMHFLDNETFLMTSYDGNWKNIRRCNIQDKVTSMLTKHESNVSTVVKIDTVSGYIFYYTGGESGAERQLYRVSLDGTDHIELTPEPGWHSVEFSEDGSFFYTNFSTITNPTQSYIASAAGDKVYTLSQSIVNRNQRSGVEIVQFEVKTDSLSLPGIYILPKNFNASRSYPVVFTTYGGPDRIELYNRYQDFSNDFYSNNGIIRVVMDHRGSGKLGRKGLDYLYRSLGQWEIHDLIEGVKYMTSLEFVDSRRIGITGSSYGGYLTCMALTLGSSYFTHGLSLYPVTDWRFYDNVYVERYMDQPKDNIEGYDLGSAINHAYRYKGDLLIVHGSADDNVHMQNTMRFIEKLQDLGKDFEMMIYPDERHGVGGAKYGHLSSLSYKYWTRAFNLTSQSTEP